MSKTGFGLQDKYGNKEYHYYRQVSMKLKMLDFCGRTCLKCGYNNSIRALHFHHIEPKTKNINLGRTRGYCWGTIKLELMKTILLCSNCHFELHDKVWELTETLIEKQKRLQNSYIDKSLEFYTSLFIIKNKGRRYAS